MAVISGLFMCNLCTCTYVCIYVHVVFVFIVVCRRRQTGGFCGSLSTYLSLIMLLMLFKLTFRSSYGSCFITIFLLMFGVLEAPPSLISLPLSLFMEMF